STQPSRRRAPVPIRYRDANIENVMSEGKVVLVLGGGVAITRQQPDGEVLEMQSQRAVLFTTLDRLRDVQNMAQLKSIEDAITAAYLEGDVRISVTPANTSLKGEERLAANRVYYEFTTDRAVLTDAVIHTVDIEKNIPVIV